MCLNVHAVLCTIDTVVSLEQSEYLVADENDTLSVSIVMSDVTSQDVIVEVTISDETATGKHCSMYATSIILIVYVSLYSWNGL